MFENISFPSVEEVQKKWKRPNVINFLEENKVELDLDDDDIQIIVKKKISGHNFLDLSQEKLEEYGLQPGPADTIAKLAKKIKGEDQELTNKRRKIGLWDETEKDPGKFWKSLENAKIDNNFLRLSEGVYFLGDKEQGAILYIRKCYDHLSNIVFNEKIHRCRITGNPGIGKTVFGFYLLYLLSKQNKAIVYHKACQYPILFNKQHTFRSDNISDFKGYLDNTDVWYIVDGQPPLQVHAKTILFCSPQKQHYKEFDKMVGTTIRLMPVWSWNEVNECRIGMFNHLEEAKVEDLYSRWGGIPRFILEKALDSSQQNHLEDAISKSNGRLFEFVGEIDHADDVSHRIIHIHTNLPDEDGGENEESEEAPYIQKFIRFASEWVAEKVMDKLERNYSQQLRNFVIASSSENEYSTLRGVIFEQIAHRILQKGGTFNIRPLESDITSSTIEIPERIKLVFNDINKIEEGKYCQPIQKNFTSVDAVVAPDTLFQMTASKIHPINMNGMKKLVEKLGGKSGTNHIYFYFVLPKDLFDNYQAQHFHTTGKTVAKKIPRWITNRVKQYALEIDLSS
ncbi:7378_t:CDS:2 [Entrophospora sp. SA101]|nr:13214_t:CDS:2 [Entrophospora sp. SA101]CAJ0647503.1 7378_t:CDS:2 [Entrophospora sp. SA101]CAJ0846163.1 10048_t:CDS:2 [Entrophospora sp. SA101]